jgi:hypothetical protein
VFHGIGDQTRHAVGVEVSIDGVAGGDPALPRGIASVGAVRSTGTRAHPTAGAELW